MGSGLGRGTIFRVRPPPASQVKLQDSMGLDGRRTSLVPWPILREFKIIMFSITFNQLGSIVDLGSNLNKMP